MNFRQANHFDFPEIIEILEEINLDMEDLEPAQFVVGVLNDTVVGVGRIRSHDSCFELCSIGVLEEHRGKGFGKGIVQLLLKNCNEQKSYVVTDIPAFFEKFGFAITNELPDEIAAKRQMCISELGCNQAQVLELQAR
jgi:N-acetylglutamate synthase-like GNAT family acetyltransferase